MRDISIESKKQWDVVTSDKYKLTDFSFDGEPLNFEENNNYQEPKEFL